MYCIMMYLSMERVGRARTMTTRVAELLPDTVHVTVKSRESGRQRHFSVLNAINSLQSDINAYVR